MQLEWLVLAAVLVIAWLFLRRRSAARSTKEPAAANEGKTEDTKFHAVSIRYGKDACAAAKSVTGQRFLADEAPRLPLPRCDAAVCECRFAHHKDRRSGHDRRSPFGGGSIGGGTGRFDQERRTAPDRRKNADPDNGN
jgi:hypothetical protein